MTQFLRTRTSKQWLLIIVWAIGIAMLYAIGGLTQIEVASQILLFCFAAWLGSRS